MLGLSLNGDDAMKRNFGRDRTRRRSVAEGTFAGEEDYRRFVEAAHRELALGLSIYNYRTTPADEGNVDLRD